MKRTGREQYSRKPAVAGMFYSASARRLREDVEKLLDNVVPAVIAGVPGALLVPHAGFVYSGRIAAEAYSLIGSGHRYRRFFIIGSSHTHHFTGAALFDGEEFSTPLGGMKVDRDVCETLTASSLFKFNNGIHSGEHSLEVQLPFLQVRAGGNIPVVPLIAGSGDASVYSRLAKELMPWFNEENLFIFSSDFSHYPDYDTACRVDAGTAEAISTGEPANLEEWIEGVSHHYYPGLRTAMCGYPAGMIMLHMLKSAGNMTVHHLKYGNSGDTPGGDRSRVVGYHAFAASRPVVRGSDMATAADTGVEPGAALKSYLLRLARHSIARKLGADSAAPEQPEEYKTLESSGLFVTLYDSKGLRGCIGRLFPSGPVADTVKEMAISAAFADSRFKPVTADELPGIRIEISLLSPLRGISGPEEIRIGIHGVYLRQGTVTATFLPEVALEQNWSVEELLRRLSSGKAGLGEDAWKSSELFVYTSDKFGE